MPLITTKQFETPFGDKISRVDTACFTECFDSPVVQVHWGPWAQVPHCRKGAQHNPIELNKEEEENKGSSKVRNLDWFGPVHWFLLQSCQVSGEEGKVMKEEEELRHQVTFMSILILSKTLAKVPVSSMSPQWRTLIQYLSEYVSVPP